MIRPDDLLAEPSRFTADVAARCVFVDFESLKDGDPLLVGTLNKGKFEQCILDARLADAARAKDLSVQPLGEYCNSLLDYCEMSDGVIVAFSEKELQDLERLTGRKVKVRYLNVLKLAKRWRARFFPAEHERVMRSRERLRRRNQYIGGRGNQLLDFTRIANMQPPHDYGSGYEAARIRHVFDQLAKRGSYSRLTPVAKGKWTKALKHNAFDVLVLERLCRRIADDYATN